NSENAAFLACLRELAAQGDSRAVGPSSGRNYAPAQFEGMTAAKGHDRAALKRAMDRLYAIGKIETVTIRNKAKGRDVDIIREVPDRSPIAPPIASRPVPDHAPDRIPIAPRSVPDHNPDRLPSPLGEGEGAALEATAPSVPEAEGTRP